jgi:hypothetical protein
MFSTYEGAQCFIQENHCPDLFLVFGQVSQMNDIEILKEAAYCLCNLITEGQYSLQSDEEGLVLFECLKRKDCGAVIL